MKTFSQHLFRALIPGLVSALLVGGLVIQLLVKQSLTLEFDRGLTLRAEALMAITEFDEDGIELEVYTEAFATYFRVDEPDYYEISDLNGKRLFRSESLAHTQVLHNPDYTAYEPDHITDITLPDGRPGRAIQRTYYPKTDIENDAKEGLREEQKIPGKQRETRPEGVPSDQKHGSGVKNKPFAGMPPGTPFQINGVTLVPKQVRLTVATTRAPLDKTLMQLNAILLVTGVITITAVVLMLHRAILRAVVPIQQLSEVFQTLDIDRLEKHVATSHAIHEIDGLTNQLNTLMQRLHEGFQRERRFSSDLAHEIRTPLTELRMLLEVYQQWPNDKQLTASLHNDLYTSLERIEQLTGNLLALSRGELGLLEPKGNIDLTWLVQHLLHLHQPSVKLRRVTLSADVPDQSVNVIGHDQWHRILDNLIDNAIEYSPTHSTIEIRLSKNLLTDRFSIAIENPAPELTDQDLSRLFDRLWRKDKARSSERHSGLGLSLVSMYANIVGARITATLTHQGRLCMLISGPLT